MVAPGTQCTAREGEVSRSPSARTRLAVAGGSRQPAGLDRADRQWDCREDAPETVSGAAVLSLSSATRVLVATTPVDLRGSFNRLYSLVVEQLKSDPLSRNCFCALRTGNGQNGNGRRGVRGGDDPACRFPESRRHRTADGISERSGGAVAIAREASARHLEWHRQRGV